MTREKVVHLNSEDLLALINVEKNANYAIMIGPSTNVTMFNNSFGGQRIYVEKIEKGSIAGNKEIGALEIPGGVNGVQISDNTFTATLSKLSPSERLELENALVKKDSTSKIVLKFARELAISFGAELVTKVILH